jgi:hypothetical protein
MHNVVRVLLEAELDSELDSDWAFLLTWTPLLVFCASMPLSKYFITLSDIVKSDSIRQ